MLLLLSLLLLSSKLSLLLLLLSTLNRNNAFDGCTELVSITISSSVTSIGIYAFSECTSLISIVIPSSISLLPYGIFWGCLSLKTVTIPDSVLQISPLAFSGCSFTCINWNTGITRTIAPNALPTQTACQSGQVPTFFPTYMLTPANTAAPTSSNMIYVRIQNTIPTCITLVEIQLYNNYVQIPLTALTASMSSQFQTRNPEKCIDGNTNCNGGSCDPNYLCHTTCSSSQWVLITAAGYDVNQVVVYNRQDNLLSNVDITRINAATITISRDLAGNSIIYQSSFGSDTSYIYNFIVPNILPIISYSYDVEAEFNDDDLNFNELSNGIAASVYWASGVDASLLSPWVSWQSKDPTITFQFNGNVAITTVRIHFQNDGTNNIYLPSQVIIGDIITNLADDRVNGWREFNGWWSCNSLSITLKNRYPGGRIYISEVQFRSLGNNYYLYSLNPIIIILLLISLLQIQLHQLHGLS
jgi:hypothetical protein